MSWLRIYEKEEAKFPEFYKCIITEKRILNVIKRLSKYYGIPMPTVAFKNTGGMFYSWQRLITLPKTGVCKLGLVIHEFAHYYTYMKYKTGNHRGMFYSCLCRVYRVAKEKNFLTLSNK